VRDLCGLIFGEDRRPLVLVKDDEQQDNKQKKATADGEGAAPSPPPSDPTEDWITAFIHDTKFWLTLLDALWKGSVGSAAIVLRVLGKEKAVNAEVDGEVVQTYEADGAGHYYFEVWRGEECSPIFRTDDPDMLQTLERRYFIADDALRAQGYDVDALKEKWKKKAKRNRSPLVGDEWAVRIVLTATEEQWYLPVPRHVYERTDWKDTDWALDNGRSFMHELDEVPAEWVVPLPIDADELYPDGACLFEDCIDPEFRLNRTYSQVGRAFDYSGDPQMSRLRDEKGGVPRSQFGTATALGGTASDVLEGDAKFVEITGQGLEIAIGTYAEAVVDLGKRAAAMSRVTPNSKTGASLELSSAAMKFLNSSQLTLAGILRETAAEKPGDRMLRLAMRMWDKVTVALPSLQKPVKPDPEARFEWQWPAYYEPHGQEKVFEVQAINTAKEGQLISSQTSVGNAAPLFDVTDPDREAELIQGDTEQANADEVMQADALGEVQAKHAVKPGAGDGAK